MTINLSRLRLREQNFRTAQSVPWIDGLPVIGVPAAAGVLPGANNVGQGTLTVASVDVGAAEGAHIVEVTAVSGGQTFLTVTDPDGEVTAVGVAGLPIYAGGITFTLTPAAGGPALAVGDTFALGVILEPEDITGLTFELDSRQSTRSLTYALRAFSAPADGGAPTILNGGPAGTVAMQLLQPAMARCAVGDFPYVMTATDPETGLSVPVFVGVIRHRVIPSLND
ncbi:hypothetical protein [Methylobacterium radiotolerans]|uniref:hypothetical protein n=1 Tax=Methylobacterium radiotolerans TaxID=31998 RepID=UPI0015F38C2A|nr:hypothetical protein [Methylobacterium radiotolerans]